MKVSYLLFSALFTLIFVFGASAQQSANSNKAAAAESIINVIDPTNIPNSPAAINTSAPNSVSGSQFFDNGYIRFALTGDTKKDEETYRREKEKLFQNNPELYKKWVGESKVYNNAIPATTK